MFQPALERSPQPLNMAALSIIERKFLFDLRTKSGAWQGILPEELLQVDSESSQNSQPWLQTNFHFVPTDIEGIAELDSLSRLFQSTFDLIVCDNDGAFSTPFFRARFGAQINISHDINQYITYMLTEEGSCEIYSANIWSRSITPLYSVHKNLGKFVGLNHQLISKIHNKIIKGEKVLYFGSSDFDLLIATQVLLKLKADLFNLKVELAKARRLHKENYEIAKTEQDIKGTLSAFRNFHFATTSRKLV